MKLSILTIFLPAITAGFIIPDPQTARQLFLDPNKDVDTREGSFVSSIAAENENPLSRAFQEAIAARKEETGDQEKRRKVEYGWGLPGNWLGSEEREFRTWWEGLQNWIGDMMQGKEGKHGDHGSKIHDILKHHGFLNHEEKDSHSQPHGDHGHDGLSGHHNFHDIPKPIRDGHYHENSTIWDLVTSCPETSIFASLAKKDSQFHNLLKDPKQNVTIFVPSDTAFRRLMRLGILPPEEDIPEDMLSDILNYHSAIGTHISYDMMHHNTLISRFQDDKLGKGYHQRLRLGLDQVHGPSVNFFADILLVDVLAKNGVIHGLSSVLLPPPSISTILTLVPTEFSTTSSAMYRSGLIHELPSNSSNGLTIFAPSNRDWEKLGWRAMGFLFSDYGKEYLKALLKYHIVPGKTLYSDALDQPVHDHKQHHRKLRGKEQPPTPQNALDDPSGLYPGYTHLQLPTLLKDKDLNIDITRFERYLSFRVNGLSEVIISDGIAKDGVVHVPNHVLIPSCHGGGDHGDMEMQGIWDMQKNGKEIDVDDLRRVLEPFVEKERERERSGLKYEEEL